MSSRANILLLALAAIIIAGFASVVAYKTLYTPSEESSSSTANEITLANVSQHTTPESCWLVIGQKVYNMTPYITAHTDETTYKDLCGTDATLKLAGDSPNKQSEKLQKTISPYYIGILVP